MALAALLPVELGKLVGVEPAVFASGRADPSPRPGVWARLRLPWWHMGFWQTQIGPRRDGDARGEPPGRLRIGEVVCPRCDNVIARIFDDPGGIAVFGWVRASSPSDPGGRSIGWSLYGLIDGTVRDDATEALHCWRDHHGLAFSAGLCREIVDVYRHRGRKVRRPGQLLAK